MQKNQFKWLLLFLNLFIRQDDQQAFKFYISHSRPLGEKEKFLTHRFYFKKVPILGNRSVIAWRGKKTRLKGSSKKTLLEIKEEVSSELLGRFLLILANEAIQDSAQIKARNRNNTWAWEAEETLPTDPQVEFMELLEMVAPEIYNVSTAIITSDPAEELVAA